MSGEPEKSWWDSFISELLDLAPPPTRAERRAAALQAISDWSSTTGGETMRWFCPRSDFSTRLTKLVSEPGSLHQGGYPWCMPAAFLYCMLRRFPDLVAGYGLTLYDTGSGELGDLETSVLPELQNFDLPRYVRGALQGQALPASAPMIDVEHVDWILMAGIVDSALSPYDFGGPIDFRPSLLGLPEEVEDFFEETDLYSSVGVTRLSASMTPPELFELLNEPDADIVLVGQLKRFADGLTDKTVGHATVLTDVRLESAVLKAKFWSWGDRLPPAYQAISEPGSIFGLPNSVGDFLKVVDSVVIAKI